MSHLFGGPAYHRNFIAKLIQDRNVIESYHRHILRYFKPFLKKAGKTADRHMVVRRKNSRYLRMFP